MQSYRQTKFNRRARGRRRYRERYSEDIPAEPTHRLMWGCYYDDQEIVREAIKSGAKINGEEGAPLTPLLNACKAARRETVHILLKAGADPGLAGADGTTPLHMTARRNADEIAEDLIRAGADPMVRDGDGKTPVEVALEAGHEEVAIAIQGMISLAHANRTKIIRFPNPNKQAAKKPPAAKQRPKQAVTKKAANFGLKL